MAAFHALGLAFSVALVLVGLFLRRKPEAFARFFTFGASDGAGFAGLIGRAVAWFSLVIGAVGAALYLVMIPIDLLSSK